MEWSNDNAPSLVASLSHATLSAIDGDVLTVAVRYKMHADKINQPTNQVRIETVLSDVLRAPVKIVAKVVKEPVDEDESVDLDQIFEFED